MTQLSGIELDYWVAKGLGDHRDTTPDMIPMYTFPAYSTDWALGGPIIERERIEIMPAATEGDTSWNAWIYGRGVFHNGPTPLVAAMRAYVALRGQS